MSETFLQWAMVHHVPKSEMASVWSAWLRLREHGVAEEVIADCFSDVCSACAERWCMG